MLVITSNGGEKEMPVWGNLCGYRVEEMRLKEPDIVKLLEVCKDPAMRSLLEGWLRRF